MGEQTLLYLKVLSVILAGFLGLLGTVTNFRRKDGQVTNAGIAILIGIVVAMLIAILVTVFEANHSKEQSKEQLERTTAILQEFNRTQSPIGRVSLYYSIEFPKDNQEVIAFANQVDSIIKDNFATLTKNQSGVLGLDVFSIGPEGKPLSVHIDSDFEHWPPEGTAIPAVLDDYYLSVFIYSSAIDPNKFSPIVDMGDGYSDFNATGYGTVFGRFLTYEIESRILSVSIHQEIDPGHWNSNGNVRSLVDLFGAHLFFLGPGDTRPLNPDRNLQARTAERNAMIREMTLKTTKVSFSAGRDIWIDGDRFVPLRTDYGQSVFSVILPETESGMKSLQN